MASTTEPLAPELLALLCCPETQQALGYAPAELLARLTEAQNRAGQPVGGLTAGLLRADGQVVYPIREGLPCLVPDEAIQVP